MSLKGLSEEELFDLKRSIGNNKSGFNPALGPKEVAAILEKAEKYGNSTKEISKFLNQDGKTQVKFNLSTKDQILNFQLKKSMKLDRKSLNLLRKQQIQAEIS